MIVLYSKKSNTFSSISLKNFQNTLNFGDLECSCCHSHNIIRHGCYFRNVIYLENNELTSTLLKIQRVRCKSCGVTHALLPSGIIPYKQFCSEVILTVLIRILTETVDVVSKTLNISCDIVKKWKKQFKNIHFPFLKTTFDFNYIDQILISIKNDIDYKNKYISNNNRCFMQIKLGNIIICPF